MPRRVTNSRLKLYLMQGVNHTPIHIRKSKKSSDKIFYGFLDEAALSCVSALSTIFPYYREFALVFPICMWCNVTRQVANFNSFKRNSCNRSVFSLIQVNARQCFQLKSIGNLHMQPSEKYPKQNLFLAFSISSFANFRYAVSNTVLSFYLLFPSILLFFSQRTVSYEGNSEKKKN